MSSPFPSDSPFYKAIASKYEQLKLLETPMTVVPPPAPDIKLVRTALYLLKEANISIEEKDYDRAFVCVEDALDSLRKIDNG